MINAKCPSCKNSPRGVGRYLCIECWSQLTRATQKSLVRRDSQAFFRLRELHRQLDVDTPLSEIKVKP